MRETEYLTIGASEMLPAHKSTCQCCCYKFAARRHGTHLPLATLPWLRTLRCICLRSTFLNVPSAKQCQPNLTSSPRVALTLLHNKRGTLKRDTGQVKVDVCSNHTSPKFLALGSLCIALCFTVRTVMTRNFLEIRLAGNAFRRRVTQLPLIWKLWMRYVWCS